MPDQACFDVIIIDGAALVNQTEPVTLQTFKEYAENELFIPHVLTQLRMVSRADIVWDRYIEGSLKEQTRETRGTGIRRRVEDQTKLHQNWHSFLCNNDNKTELFHYLAQKLSMLDVGDKELYTTYDEDVLSAKSTNKTKMERCTNKEADTRMLIHADHAARQ